ncbi:uncharacterized protein LOC120071357 isoform X2 [Benincasa hispida]|uniref:uncharacterized protein LOC120071357 isoform X2 n=1 Tax=Benincasa hispida TaxID=102211 RepID=UPI0018FF60A0|nr:uncharacterized protein LOC120071357 isoform X2 [Benincasa hispida]
MVQFLDSYMTLYPEKLPVKRERDDSFHHEHAQLDKRFKPDFHKSVSGPDTLSATSSHNNPLDEPSPLGLVLRKSPSLLDLIQMKLSQGSASTTAAGPSNTETFNFVVKAESQDATVPGTNEKLKASNFPASLLRIGRWEYKSRHEGDLVAKCYYAKHKLVWEILEGGLKSKIEIQWSDIMALNANCPDDGPAILNVVLARRPLFFRETNPQPRKHTLWQATADFTDGEASIQRQHFLQCPYGLLNKHFEKLIQCDSRLNFLSRQPEIVLGSPYFEPIASTFTTLQQASIHGLEQAENDNQSLLSTFQDVVSSSAVSSLKIEKASPQMVFEPFTVEAPSPSSVMDAHEIEENRSTKVTRKPRNWEQIKVPGIHPSVSMSDLVNHIGHHITEQMASTKTPFVDNGSEEYQSMLDDIAQYLLSDNQLSAASDEVSLMSRVDSLCCLLQKEPVQSSQTNGENCVEGANYRDDVAMLRDGKNIEDHIKIHPETTQEVSGSIQASAMSRKDSYGDLLLHLPRIASLPKLLFDISDGDEGQD